MIRLFAVAAFFVWCALGGFALAAETIELGGSVKTPLRLTLDELRKLPSATVDVSYMTGKGEEKGSFTGVTLWSLLEKAVVVEDGEKGSLLRRVIVVTGRDGYAVVIAAGEIAPNFENKAVVLAYAKDGQALPEEHRVRLIVPGDKHAGRAVRDVVKIDVR